MTQDSCVKYNKVLEMLRSEDINTVILGVVMGRKILPGSSKRYDKEGRLTVKFFLNMHIVDGNSARLLANILYHEFKGPLPWTSSK